MEEEEVKALRGCIHYWEEKLRGMRAFLSPSEEVLIQQTINCLKRLEGLEGE